METEIKAQIREKIEDRSKLTKEEWENSKFKEVENASTGNESD